MGVVLFSTLQNQEDLFAHVDISIGKSNVVLKSLTGTECMSGLFEFKAVFTSPEKSVNIENLLGTNINIEFKSNSYSRNINGIIAEISQENISVANSTQIAEYTVVIRPKLWLLTLDKNYLIFQNKNTIGIIKQILKDNGINDIDDQTSSCGKVVREYCVQYAESSFNFISRLMEDEGIFYFFEHKKGKHTLVLADDLKCYKKLSNNSKIDFLNVAENIVPLGKFSNISIKATVNTGSYATADYNYTISNTKLFSKLDTKWKGPRIYDYPGGFSKIKEGDDLSKLRVQEFEFKRKIYNIESTFPDLAPGFEFELKGYSVSNFNQKYTAYRIDHHFSSEESSVFIYKNNIQAFEKDVCFRPPRTSLKPKIFGTQSAIVTTPSNEEIFRNEYCCVKVHFYWDQIGKKTDTNDSSCWIRVAQPLAGSGWGAVFVPRVGQEVIVSFQNGDPDKPLIVGCVYNDKYLPPYSDKEAMRTAIKTVTFKNAKGFNEISFFDQKDKEEIFTHAQRDMNIDINNSRKTDIHESDDLLNLLKGSRIIKLMSDNGKSISNHSLSIKKGNHIVELEDGNYQYTIKKGNEKITIEKGNKSIKLSKGDLSYDVTGDCTFKVSGDITIKATGNINIESNKNVTIKAGQKVDIKSGTAMNIKSGTNLTIKSGTGFKAQSGMAMTIKAGMNLNASANIGVSIKANVSAELKGVVSSKVTGAIAELAGQGMAKVGAPMITIGGGMVKLG